MRSEHITDAFGAHVAGILKEERKKRGLSLQRLARQCGIARQTLSYIEQTAESPKLSTLRLIAVAMEVSLGDVIMRAEKLAPIPISQANTEKSHGTD